MGTFYPNPRQKQRADLSAVTFGGGLMLTTSERKRRAELVSHGVGELYPKPKLTKGEKRRRKRALRAVAESNRNRVAIRQSKLIREAADLDRQFRGIIDG